jgi:hypothetical protein
MASVKIIIKASMHNNGPSEKIAILGNVALRIFEHRNPCKSEEQKDLFAAQIYEKKIKNERKYT